MANGSTRLALAQMQLDKKQQDENKYLKTIEDKKTKPSKIPLKYPTKNNHSK